VQLRLKEWRERRGFSIRQLAEQAGVSHVTVVRIEQGRMSPTVALLEKLAGALGISVRDFFSGKR
jgi:transcriptional regulator with XRE-family HTH domain